MTAFDELPLARLFYELQQRGLPLGVDDYESLLRAIQAGYCGDTLHDLKKLCSTLWAKTEADAYLLNILFLDNIRSFDTTNETIMGSPDAGDGTSGDPLEGQSIATEEEGWDNQNIYDGRLNLPDQANMAQPIRHFGLADGNWVRSNYRSSIDYFPVTRRQMKQAWRQLRQMVRVGPPTELDLDLTIDKTAHQGVLNELILLPR